MNNNITCLRTYTDTVKHRVSDHLELLVEPGKMKEKKEFMVYPEISWSAIKWPAFMGLRF